MVDRAQDTKLNRQVAIFLCWRTHAGYAIGAVFREGLKNGVLTMVAGTR